MRASPPVSPADKMDSPPHHSPAALALCPQLHPAARSICAALEVFPSLGTKLGQRGPAGCGHLLPLKPFSGFCAPSAPSPRPLPSEGPPVLLLVSASLLWAGHRCLESHMALLLGSTAVSCGLGLFGHRPPSSTPGRGTARVPAGQSVPARGRSSVSVSQGQGRECASESEHECAPGWSRPWTADVAGVSV